MAIPKVIFAVSHPGPVEAGEATPHELLDLLDPQ